MSFLEWVSTYSVNVEQLDKHHKELLSIICECHDLVVSNSFDKKAGAILYKLRLYTEKHFSLEEEYMQLADYSGFDEHKEQHDSFLEQLKEIEVTFERDGKIDSLGVVEILMDWFLNHLLDSDQNYKESLNRAGIY